MKKFAIIFLCLALAACIVACAGEGSGQTTAGTSATSVTTTSATTATDKTTATTGTTGASKSTETSATSGTQPLGDIELPKIHF